MKKIQTMLLKIEEDARRFFERIPFVQALLAGVGVIVFWRGIWEWLDRMDVSPFLSVVVGSLLLGGVGVFVQTFIGNTIIIKNVRKEEQHENKSLRIIEGEVMSEEVTLEKVAEKIDALMKKLEEK